MTGNVMAHGARVYLFLLGASLAAFAVLAQSPPDTSKGPAAAPAGTPQAATAQESDSSPPPAQSPAPSSAPPPTPTGPAASTAPASPSADTLKKARMAGYRPETKNGVTRYCQETANIGTRFPTKKCIDEQQLKGVLDIQHQQQDSMRKP